MTFRNRMNNPKTVVGVGMSFLVIAIALPAVFHPTTQFGLDLVHGVRGVAIGLSLIFSLQSARPIGRIRHSSTS
jgi:hypothetical protein